MPNPNDRIKSILQEANLFGEESVTNYERRLLSIYRNGLQNMRLQVSETFAKYGVKDGNKVVVPFEEMVKYNRLDSLSTRIAKGFSATKKDVDRVISDAIKESYRESYFIHSYAVDSSVNIDFVFKMLDANAIRAALVNPLIKIQWPGRTAEHIKQLNRQVQDAIVETFQQGYGYKKASKIYAEKMGVSASKMTNILWTETHRAQNAARLLSWEEVKKSSDKVGVKVERRWDATLDKRTRPDHQDLDNEPADAEGYWTFPTGGKTQGPGLSGLARQDIRCRCTTVSWFSDLPPEYRYDREARRSVKYQTYPEWAEKHGVKPKWGGGSKLLGESK